MPSLWGMAVGGGRELLPICLHCKQQAAVSWLRAGT